MSETDTLVLRQDLLSKLESLQLWNEFPELKLADYFDEILCEDLLTKANAEQALKVSEKRAEFMRELDTQQQLLLEKASSARNGQDSVPAYGTTTTYEQLRQTIEAIEGLPSRAEEQYERIFHELMRQTHKLEKQLLAGQSFFFVEMTRSLDRNVFGILVRMQNDYLSQHEIFCLKFATFETFDNE